jgi:hypothetical protein
MNKQKYFPPTLGTDEFHCPHCQVYSKQLYSRLVASDRLPPHEIEYAFDSFFETLPKQWVITKCLHCENYIIWHNSKIIFPKAITIDSPNEDLNPEIINDYNEATLIFNDSPRAAAALLRLALQKLCKQLGEKGENINDDIKELVLKGLNPLVQKSLDALRITGNNAVHPGEINLEEEPEKVTKLFELLNFIANKMISEPKEIEKFYENLPTKSKEAIIKRDTK